MRGKLFLLLIGAVMTFFGGWEGYVWATNREPAKMTCTQFLTGDQSAKWVELSDCDVDYAGAIQLTSRFTKSDKGSYVPVRPAGAVGPAMLLLTVDSATAEAKVAAILSGQASPKPERQTVTGLIAFGSSDREKVRKVLQKGSDVAPDFQIIQSGKRPEATGLLLGLAGVVILGWTLRNMVKGPKAASPPPLPPTAA